MSEEAWMEEFLIGAACQFAADLACRGRLEWHHCITKNRLKRTFRFGAWRHIGDEEWRPLGRHGSRSLHAVEILPLGDILGDTRNRVIVCSAHHELVTNGRLKVQLPDSVWEFAREFGLEGMLENDLRRAA